MNLIGEHTDYNDGLVLPIAIEMATRVAFAATGGTSLLLRSGAFPGHEVDLSLGGTQRRCGDWADYVRGVLVELEELGIAVPPGALWVDGDLPLGAGLASSASLEVAVAGALLALAGRELPREELALACQRAESRFVGARCGFMDQFASCFGQEGHALLLDCRSRTWSAVPWPDAVEIVIVNSGVRHSLAEGEYNRRREECEAAVEILARDSPIRTLRDVEPSALERVTTRLPEDLRRRVRHVVSENARVLAFVDSLRDGDFVEAGRLLSASHESLRCDYEVSCRELDWLVERAGRHPSVYGARMTGAGFGGCSVNLVRAGAGAEVLGEVRADQRRLGGPSVEGWVVRAASGAGLEEEL